MYKKIIRGEEGVKNKWKDWETFIFAKVRDQKWTKGRVFTGFDKNRKWKRNEKKGRKRARGRAWRLKRNRSSDCVCNDDLGCCVCCCRSRNTGVEARQTSPTKREDSLLSEPYTQGKKGKEGESVYHHIRWLGLFILRRARFLDDRKIFSSARATFATASFQQVSSIGQPMKHFLLSKPNRSANQQRTKKK